MNLVGNKAPDFKAAAVMADNKIVEDFSLHSFRGKDMAVVFFYPLDFTFVCPSEIIAFNNRVADFASKGVKVIGVSVDSHFTHLAWKNTDINRGWYWKYSIPSSSRYHKKYRKRL